MWLNEVTTWGLLPVVVPLVVMTARRLAWWLMPQGAVTEMLAATAVLSMALVHVSVGVLGTFGCLTRESLLLALVSGTAFVVFKTRAMPRQQWLRRAFSLNPIAVVASFALVGAAMLTARILPIWQWDSFGYHLPYVNFVLQSHGFSDVPSDLRYITTYPHDIELGMIWLRAMLPDDRLVDIAQVPYGIAGAALVVAIARRLGATPSLALLSAAAWLAVPSVFLQLPTNYVDVGTAAALLGALFFLVLTPVSRVHFALGGLALGLFLGSKPSAPVAVGFLGLVMVVRAARAGQGAAIFIALACTLVFGGEMYAVMLVRHGNPVWPVAVHLGPFTLPGDHSVDELLAAGSALPRATGNVLERLTVSWLAIDANPVFDMRLGGFGLVFLLAFPLAVFGLVRKKSWAVGVALLAALLSPDPSVARYVLAFPALMFALAATQVRPGLHRLATGLTLAAMIWSVHHAWPGLVGDGPEWSAFLQMTDDERRVAVGPHGTPTDYPPAWAEVGPGESVAFDIDFEFPGLLWSPDLRYPVLSVPKNEVDLEAWLDARNVRLVAVGERHRAELSDAWVHLFECRSSPCAVFVRRREVTASR